MSNLQKESFTLTNEITWEAYTRLSDNTQAFMRQYISQDHYYNQYLQNYTMHATNPWYLLCLSEDADIMLRMAYD